MPKISLSGPADLLTVIPFQLGFHPSRSVVVICFQGRRIGMVARLDVVPVEDPGPARIEESVAETLSVLLRERPSSVALAGFEEEPGESRWLVATLTDALEAAGVDVCESVVVRTGRWFDVLRSCCVEGHRLPEPSEVPAVATFVALGQATLASRDDLSRVFEPLAESDTRHAAICAAIEQWQSRYVATGGWCDRHPLGAGVGLPGSDGPDAWDDDAVLVDDMGFMDDLDGLDALDYLHDELDDEVGDAHDDRWPDDEPLTAQGRLLHESLQAWAAVLRGELEGPALQERLAAVVGPLRDPGMCQLVVAWLRCDPARLESWPGDPVQGLELLFRAMCPDGPAVDDGAFAASAAQDEAEPFGTDDWRGAAAVQSLQARLEALCRLTPAAHAAPLLAVVGSFAWWTGDGARAGIAVDRALELEPGHQPSLALREALSRGIRAQAGSLESR